MSIFKEIDEHFDNLTDEEFEKNIIRAGYYEYQQYPVEHCNFCGKVKDFVDYLVSGGTKNNTVYICDKCVYICSKVIEKRRNEDVG